MCARGSAPRSASSCSTRCRSTRRRSAPSKSGVWRRAVAVIDEVDVVLHPLRSELNWPPAQAPARLRRRAGSCRGTRRPRLARQQRRAAQPGGGAGGRPAAGARRRLDRREGGGDRRAVQRRRRGGAAAAAGARRTLCCRRRGTREAAADPRRVARALAQATCAPPTRRSQRLLAGATKTWRCGTSSTRTKALNRRRPAQPPAPPRPRR